MAESKLRTVEQVSTVWNLGGLTPKQLAKRAWNGINDDNLLGRASELAYNFLLAIFPMLPFLLSSFGLFAARGSQLRGNWLFYCSQILPQPAFDLVTKMISAVT